MKSEFAHRGKFFSRVDLDKTSFHGNVKFGDDAVQVFLTGAF